MPCLCFNVQNIFEAATRAAMLVRPGNSGRGSSAHEKANGAKSGTRRSSSGGNDAGGCHCVVL